MAGPTRVGDGRAGLLVWGFDGIDPEAIAQATRDGVAAGHTR